MENDARAGRSLGPEIDSLVTELLDIGQHDGFLSLEPGGKFDEGKRHIRARQIGEKLNQLGELRLMQAVYYRITVNAGSIRSRGLEFAWRDIGGWLP